MEDRLCRPDEHAGIPQVLAVLIVHLGGGAVRFFLKRRHLVGQDAAFCGELRPDLDIAVAGLRSRRINPDGNQVFTFPRDPHALTEYLEEFFRGLDKVIGGKHDHDRVRVPGQ